MLVEGSRLLRQHHLAKGLVACHTDAGAIPPQPFLVCLRSLWWCLGRRRGGRLGLGGDGTAAIVGRFGAEGTVWVAFGLTLRIVAVGDRFARVVFLDEGVDVLDIDSDEVTKGGHGSQELVDGGAEELLEDGGVDGEQDTA